MSKKELTDNAEEMAAVVKYWNLTDAAERPFAYHGVDIYLGTELLEPSGKGKFTIPNSGFIEAKQIAAKGEGFDARVKGLSGPEKSEWEANDRSRSLAALPKKAVAKPDPVVAAPVTAPLPLSEPEPEPEPEYSPENDADMQDDAADDYAYQDQSVDEAKEAISAQFSDADEYRRWAARTIVGLATVSSVMWYMQNSEAGNADKAVQATEDKISATEQEALNRCSANPDPQCYDALIQALRDPANTNFHSLYLLDGYLKDNKAARDSYQSAATLWLTATGLSIAGSIVLFAW